MTASQPLSAPSSATTPTMRAVVQDTYGTADVLRVAGVPRPTPGSDEVLVRVHAAGLDRGTWHLMTGTPYAARLVVGIRRPRNPVPGRDVAGTVAAVGSAVTRFAVGDEVFGIAPGSFAEYAVAPERKLARKPETLSFEQAAVVPISALTALQAVVDVGHIQSGQTVLVTGASGGVGSYAVQLAASSGARVTGVCSTAKQELVRALGADHVIDYTRQDFADGAQQYDLIIDIAGNPSLSRLRRALTPRGTAVLVGGEDAGRWTGMSRQLRAVALSPFVAQRLTIVVAKEKGSDLERLCDLIAAGAVTPSLDRVFSLDEVPQAMRRLAAGEARGKVAISI